MARLVLSLLGGFQAHSTSGSVVTLPTRKSQALLAYLACPPGQAHPRDKLAALLWGEMGVPQARSGLRQALFPLRKALIDADPPGLRLEAGTVALDPKAVDVDVASFEQAATDGSPESLERAAALYRGDFLAGLSVREATFEEWLVIERERLKEVALDVMARLLAHQRSTGAPGAAVQTARRLLALDPLQEPVHRALMRLYARFGRRGSALRQYQVCVSVLDRDLGTVPETETRQLYQHLLKEPFDIGSSGEMEQPRPHPSEDSPLIGRAPEMATLREALTNAWAGRGRLVVARGEAGIGKSRLMTEISADAAARDGRVLVGRSYEAERILAFGAWVDALRAARLTDERGLLAELDPIWRVELARLLPEVAASPSPSSAPTDYRQLFEAIAQLIERLAAARPLLLILEDVHWADEMSLRLLSYIGRRVSTWPVLVVLTARDEDLVEAPAVRRTLEDLAREGLIEVALGRLSRADTVALVRTLARAGADDALSASRAERIWTASEGNPFMTVEMLRAIEESPASAPLEGLLPDRVREVIVRRLDRLSAPAAQLVAVTSVIGRDFNFTLLRQAAESTESATAEALEELVRRRLLHGVGENFDFTHDRIRETAYGRLIEPRRKVLHRRVADALETLCAGNVESHALALGLHYREADVPEKAARYLRQAGRVAAARSANHDAVVCFEQALTAIGRLPETRATREHAIDVRFDLRNTLTQLAEHERVLDSLREAEELATAIDDHARLARVSTYLTTTFFVLGDYDRALGYSARARTLIETIGDLQLDAEMKFRLGQVYHVTGDYRRGIDVLAQNVDRLDGELLRERFGLPYLLSVFSRAWLAWCQGEMGHFAEGLASAEQGARLAAEVDQPFSLIAAQYTLGLLHLQRGDFGRAIAVLEANHALCRAKSNALFLPFAASALGLARAQSGASAEAVPLVEQAVEQVSASGAKCFRTLVGARLSEVYLVDGRLDDARETAVRELKVAQERKERGNQAWILHLLGEIACERQRRGIEHAEDSYTEAMTLARACGMRPLIARCHLGLGRLYRRARSHGKSDEHLAEAATLFRAMDMPFWVQRTEATAAVSA